MMKYYPNSGYVAMAGKVASLLKPEDREEFLELISDPENNYLDFDEWIADHGLLDSSVSLPEFYTFQEEDVSEDFSPGDIIAIFHELDLFELTPTPALKRMTQRGVYPIKSTWSAWG